MLWVKQGRGTRIPDFPTAPAQGAQAGRLRTGHLKLALCYACSDVIRLQVGLRRSCRCGKTSGAYNQDAVHAWVSGPCIVIGLSNASLRDVMKKPVPERHGDISAFVFDEKENERIVRLDSPPPEGQDAPLP